jgi:hypothetical protein
LVKGGPLAHILKRYHDFDVDPFAQILGCMIYGGIFMVDLVKGGLKSTKIKTTLSLFKGTCMHEYFIVMVVVM